MTENYTKAQRDKRDFDRTMKTLDRENKIKLHLINNEQQEIGSSLLDLQSKSKNLSDTITYITTQLVEQKKKAEEQLKSMSIDRSNARHTNEAEGEEEITKIQKRIGYCNNKLDWLNPKKPVIKESMKVIDILTSKTKGFGAVLTKIRAAKQEAATETPVDPTPPNSPKDICSLIEHFKKLPKIYPTKPKKKKPKQSVMMLEKYAERKKEREKAMSYGTRRRLRRVEFHCDTLKELFTQIDGR